jgi:hypothetical protein
MGQKFLYASAAQQNGFGLGSLDNKTRFLITNSDPVGHHDRLGKERHTCFPPARPANGTTVRYRNRGTDGEPASIAEPLQIGGPSFSASENGVLIFRRCPAGARLTWFDRTGKPLGTAGDAGGTVWQPNGIIVFPLAPNFNLSDSHTAEFEGQAPPATTLPVSNPNVH